ncbi:hypothetical protein M5E86_03095 [Blautia wexlerae]|nr:hypothetical protein M5E86_03095 [Blautia wexlerae]
MRKPAYLWMTEDALRQDYARYESAEQLDSHMSRMEHRGNMVMGDTRIEALDNSLFDKLASARRRYFSYAGAGQ